MIDFTAWLWGWNVRVNGVLSLFSFWDALQTSEPNPNPKYESGLKLNELRLKRLIAASMNFHTFMFKVWVGGRTSHLCMYWHIRFEVINIINYIILPDKADRWSCQEKKYCTLALTWRQKYLHFLGGKVKVYFYIAKPLHPEGFSRPRHKSACLLKINLYVRSCNVYQQK